MTGPTVEAFAVYNEGVERAREAYATDPLAASRQSAYASLNAHISNGVLTADEAAEAYAEVYGWAP